MEIELKEIKNVVALLTSCKNLDVLTIKYEIRQEEHFLKELQNHLMSIRDPTLQDPLKLTLHKTDGSPNFHVEDVNETYLKVYYTYSKWDSPTESRGNVYKSEKNYK
ncbi:uncharacterized protein LOC110191652 [Drosophila serrata]|uniref:uncharacterized protein LOC110191652 n=1 Tax=Drosophila serrata TaxID=7274 RepID=UPI000A1D0537|nr:uncharacterized protein LOC110191652 [Drosophila serrata]